VRLLLEIDAAAHQAEAVAGMVAGVTDAVRRELGIRVEAASVPAGSLPRYELKARRVVVRGSGKADSPPR